MVDYITLISRAADRLVGLVESLAGLVSRFEDAVDRFEKASTKEVPHGEA